MNQKLIFSSYGLLIGMFVSIALVQLPKLNSNSLADNKVLDKPTNVLKQEKAMHGSAPSEANAAELTEVLTKSRVYRESSGAPSLEVLWYAENEADLLIWAENMHARLSKRFELDGFKYIVFLGEEGSGISKQSIYLFRGNSDGWNLQLVHPARAAKAIVEVDLAKRMLVIRYDKQQELVSFNLI